MDEMFAKAKMDDDDEADRIKGYVQILASSLSLSLHPLLIDGAVKTDTSPCWAFGRDEEWSD